MVHFFILFLKFPTSISSVFLSPISFSYIQRLSKISTKQQHNILSTLLPLEIMHLSKILNIFTLVFEISQQHKCLFLKMFFCTQIMCLLRFPPLILSKKYASLTSSPNWLVSMFKLHTYLVPKYHFPSPVITELLTDWTFSYLDEMSLCWA